MKTDDMAPDRIRRTLLAAGAALPLAASWRKARAAAYPSRPPRIIVPAPPGGLIDTVARTVGQQLGERLGQPFVVENHAGASGTMGSEMVARSAPDGYTLLTHASLFLITPMLMKNVSYDVLKDFTPVSRVGSVPLVVAANPAVATNNLREFIALIKAHPGKYAFGTSGVGSIGHLTLERMRCEQGLDVLIVHYKGIAPAIVDLLGGQVQAMIDPVPLFADHIRAGKIKALAVTSGTRVKQLPQVATLKESGAGDFEAGSWYGMWGPAGMPADIANLLAAEVARAMATPHVVERLAGQGLVPIGSKPAELAAFERAEIDNYGSIIRNAKIGMD